MSASEAQTLCNRLFIDVIFGGNTYEASQVRGRKEEYKTTDEACCAPTRIERRHTSVI
jgi:hypothetical protein